MLSNPDFLLNMETSAALSNGGAPVPHVVFQSSALPVSDRFAAWRESILPLFESIPQERPETFRACVKSVDLGHVFIGKSTFSPLRFRREKRHPASDGADHLMVQLYLAGGYVGHNGYRDICVRAGDIGLLDLGCELQTRAQASTVLSLIIPREQIYAYIDPKRLAYGTVLRGDSAMGRILGNQLLATWQELSTASVEEVGGIKHFLLSSVVGAFSGLSVENDRKRERVTLEAARAYIEQNLTDHLQSEDLCRHFSCSRAQLYRLFQPLGGVAAYIRTARLQRCWEELTERGGKKQRIFDVASRWGFTSQSHFNRLFRQTFGVTPGEAAGCTEAQLLSWQATPYKDARNLPALHDILRQL